MGGVAGAPWATRECTACHASDSILAAPFELARSAAAGVGAEAVTLVGDANVHLAGAVERAADGRLVYRPDIELAGLYVLGHSRSGAVDTIGLLAVLTALAGVAIHGGLRIRRYRKRHAGVRS